MFVVLFHVIHNEVGSCIVSAYFFYRSSVGSKELPVPSHMESVLEGLNDLSISQNGACAASADLNVTMNAVSTREDKRSKSVDRDVIKVLESAKNADGDLQYTAEALLHDAVCRALAALNQFLCVACFAASLERDHDSIEENEI